MGDAKHVSHNIDGTEKENTAIHREKAEGKPTDFKSPPIVHQ
jgi:hypothetical protein